MIYFPLQELHVDNSLTMTVEGNDKLIKSLAFFPLFSLKILRIQQVNLVD